MRNSLKLRLSESIAKFACALPNVSKFKVGTSLMWHCGRAPPQKGKYIKLFFQKCSLFQKKLCIFAIEYLTSLK